MRFFQQIRKLLSWQNFASFSAYGIGILLLFVGSLSIIQGINLTKERESTEIYDIDSDTIEYVVNDDDYIFDSLYNAAKLQYDNTQYIEAQSTLAKMDSNHLTLQKVKLLLQAIEKAIPPNVDEVFQQALRDGNWIVIENLAHQGYSKAYYKLAKRYYDQRKYTLAKQWATQALNARVNMAESKSIIDKINEEEYFNTGSNLFQKWVNTGDSLTRENAIKTLLNANQNNQLVKNMLDELRKERKINNILH